MRYTEKECNFAKYADTVIFVCHCHNVIKKNVPKSAAESDRLVALGGRSLYHDGE